MCYFQLFTTGDHRITIEGFATAASGKKVKITGIELSEEPCSKYTLIIISRNI